MAERRMFAKSIVDSDDFLDMPAEAQLLYFHLSMRADDDGFITPKKVMRLIGAKDDSIKLLIAKNFIIPFDTGVIVIRHWRINNYLRNDRYKETEYMEEKKQLTLVNNRYEKTDTDTQGIPLVYQRDTQVRLGKVRLGKDNDNSLRSLSCSEPSCESPEQKETAVVETSEIFLLYPTEQQKPEEVRVKDDDPVMWALKRDAVERYKKAYPTLDVEAELRAAQSWCLDNRSKRKAAYDMPRFLNGWLSREHNEGGYSKKRASPANAIERDGMADGVYDLRRMK